jgi:hypothetical protein
MGMEKIGDIDKASKSSKLQDDDPPPYPGGPSSSTHVIPHAIPDNDDESRVHGASSDAVEYSDPHMTCTATALTIRWYYFPIGSKVIPLAAIRGIEHVPLGLLTGRGRLWGTANAGVWAHLDASRPSKTEGILLDLVQHVKPLITPDDVPALLEVLVRHTGLEVREGHGRVV